MKKILKAFIIISGALLLFIIGWAFQLNQEIRLKIANQWFLPPVEIYSAPKTLSPGQTLKVEELENYFLNLAYRKRTDQQKIFAKDFSLWPQEVCQNYFPEELGEGSQCFVFKDQQIKLVLIDEQKMIQKVFTGEPLEEVQELKLTPELFAQFYGGKPILRDLIKLGEVPLYCSQAVTAIEDSQFLKHKGVSPVGLFRALISNILKGRYAQGGSTITQQLVKNYFLTSEKTIKRKVTELFMSLLLELQVEKEQILESYLNVIYMGQNGPFEVRGFSSAAKHYFFKPLESLELHECATLAALLNSPGRYNPFNNPEKTLKRRNIVLKKMRDLNMVDEDSFRTAVNNELPKRKPQRLADPAPYFVDALFKELEKLNINKEEGLKIYTSLNVDAQKAAQRSLSTGLKELESNYKSLSEKAEQGKRLEGLIISVDLKDGSVTSLMGGRSYLRSQYNRATESHRQVGSVMKPFVYLAALESQTDTGDDYTPLTLISDEKFTHKYEGQSWSPNNYSKKSHGMIPMFYALKNSINIATAKLGIDIGLGQVIDVAKRLGITSEIKPFPSLTLGAFEIYPMEIAQSYSTLARFGSEVKIHLINKVESSSRDLLYLHENNSEQLISPEVASVLVGMLKQTVLSGTARSLSWRGVDFPAAGKTGTTSDTRDAWFSGFTPEVYSLVWVGYDDNTPHGLTGASGALPIWANFMKEYSSHLQKQDFNWPEATEDYDLSSSQVEALIPEPNEKELEGINLRFRSGNAP